MKSERSPISGFGSKSKACEQVAFHEYIPRFTSVKQVYVEPFVFSGVVFFNTNAKSAILNDKDHHIYNFWHVIKDDYESFKAELKYVWIGKDWFDVYKKRDDDVGKAVFFYICNRITRMGFISSEFEYKYNPRSFEKNLDRWARRMDEMYSLAVWNLDFSDLYERLMDKGGEQREFFFYVDPPYITRGDAYVEKMTPEDHDKLAEYHWQMKEKKNVRILISYDDVEWVRKKYDGWFMKEISWATGIVNRKGLEYNELLISNVEIERRSPAARTFSRL